MTTTLLPSVVMQWAVGIQGKLCFADVLIALGAKETVAARSDQRNHDMIARFHRCDPGANFIDHPRRLVSIHRGDLTTPATVHENDVTVANGAGGNLDLAGPGCIEFECFRDARCSPCKHGQLKELSMAA